MDIGETVRFISRALSSPAVSRSDTCKYKYVGY